MNPHNPFGSADFKSAQTVSYLLHFLTVAITYVVFSWQSAAKYAHAQPSNDHDCDHDSRLQGKGRSETGGLLDNRQLHAAVNGARVASRHSLHPNTKKRACFFHTPYNQSVFQSRGWFLPGNASLVDATFGLASRSNAMRERKRRDTGGPESSTRGGSCRGIFSSVFTCLD